MSGQNKIARLAVFIVAGVITALVLTFAAVTTFTFGMGVIGGFILSEIIGAGASMLLSGILCVLLFDLGWVSGLFMYIYIADSFWQRAMTLVQFVFCFVFSIGASIVSVLMLSPLSGQLTPETVTTARYVGVTLFIVALVLNAASFAVMLLTSPEVAENIRVMSRKAEEIDFNAKMVASLDKQTFEQANQRITEQIPALAQQRADLLLSAYIARMGQDAKRLTSSSLPAADSDPKRWGVVCDGKVICKDVTRSKAYEAARLTVATQHKYAEIYFDGRQADTIYPTIEQPNGRGEPAAPFGRNGRG